MMPAKAPGRSELVAIAAILMATVSLSIDIILPALGEMASELGIADSSRRQWIVTALFVGLTAGQLLFGPMSDVVGRRPAIVMGIGVFVLGSLICALAPSFEVMMLGRVVQGIGAAGPRIVTVALIRDRFEDRAMAQIMSVIMGVFIMVPVLAPLVGQALLFLMPWRGLFGVLSAICLAGGLWLLLRQPETLGEPQPLRLGRLLDRKSTRLNSSHANISYAVFCLKKKKNHKTISKMWRHDKIQLYGRIY